MKKEHSHTAEFYTDKSGQHRYRIRAKNGKIVLDCAEGYRRKSDAARSLARLLKGFVIVKGFVIEK